MQPSRRRCVLRPSAEREPRKHYFLKAILPSPIHANQLRIPDEFIKRFGNGNELLRVSTTGDEFEEATISVPDGRIWKMGLKKCGDHVFFCNNWGEFAKYYSIEYGSYLVFKYEGKSEFSVVIFDSTCAEISYPFKPKHPSFTSTIKLGRVYVPADFASKYLKPKVPMKLQNSNSNGDQQWEVSCTMNYVGSLSMRIARGFVKYVRDNDLSEGDTCVFELIKRKPIVVLQVTASVSRS